MEKMLAKLFPPKLPRVEFFQEACISGQDHINLPVIEDGILWRGYDVRWTGIEKQERAQ